MNFLPSSANNSLVQTWKNEKKKKKKEKEKKKKKKREKEKSWAGSKDNFVAKGRTRFLERGEVQGHHGGRRGERSGQNRDYILNRNPPTREYLFRQLWQLRISTFVLPIRINSSLLFSLSFRLIFARLRIHFARRRYNLRFRKNTFSSFKISNLELLRSFFLFIIYSS